MDKMNPLPILAKNTSGMALVEVDGQAVVSASDLSKGLEYKDDKAVNRVFTRNQKSFRDFGLFDLSRDVQNESPCVESTRGGQVDHPCSIPKTCDTALVRVLTPGRPDGNGGGGLQDVRVFTKRGALKVCMKSNQPKAVQVQEMLIDLYEKVESGQLIGSERFGRVLTSVMQELSALKREVAHLRSQPPVAISLPTDRALPITLNRLGSHRSYTFHGGLKHHEIRVFIITRRKQTATYTQIAQEIKEQWPDNPEKHVSRSAIQRFWDRARQGRLKEFGIDVFVIPETKH
jgi:prophage antirepressor-like protein